MIKNLLKGHIRLVITYWVFGVIPALLYILLSMAITNYYIKIVEVPHIQWFFYLYLLFPFLYFPFIYVAIWRSSNQYTKNKFWPILAKIVVGLASIFLVIGAILVVNQLLHRNDIHYKINNQVALINKGLPIERNNILFTHISFANNIIVYDYKFKSPIDVDMFAKDIKPKLLDLVCSNSELTGYLHKGINISYHYRDPQDALIYEYTVKANDCP